MFGGSDGDGSGNGGGAGKHDGGSPRFMEPPSPASKLPHFSEWERGASRRNSLVEEWSKAIASEGASGRGQWVVPIPVPVRAREGVETGRGGAREISLGTPRTSFSSRNDADGLHGQVLEKKRSTPLSQTRTEGTGCPGHEGGVKRGSEYIY